MPTDPLVTAQANWARYVPGQRAGHYESYYLRANHPTKPWAFWIRYTVLSPRGRPEEAVGELWAVVFDGLTGKHAVGKAVLPITECELDRDRFAVRLGEHLLGPSGLLGEAGEITWDLTYSGDEPPLYLLPAQLYQGRFPPAKSLVGKPMARFDGVLLVHGTRIHVHDWVGSQNHNWGSRHTDRYAFGQVAGFDNAPDSFLEVASASNRLGPLRTPLLTLLVLRHGGGEHALVGLRQARRASAKFGYFWWDFTSQTDAVRISGRIEAPAEAFVGLAYGNPPGGVKHCLNTKIARCQLTVVDKSTGAREVLVAEHRALFEILTDDRRHGVEIRA